MDILITDGARLLRAHLKRTGETVPSFCEAHGLSRQIMQRALNGEQEKFDIDFALTIAAATDGAVPAPSWSKATLRVATPDELGRVHPRHRHDTPIPGTLDADADAAQPPPAAPLPPLPRDADLAQKKAALVEAMLATKARRDAAEAEAAEAGRKRVA